MWRLRADVSVTTTDYGSVLLDERAGRYWQLNQTGTTVLAELERGRTVREIVDGLVAEHDVELARATADVRQLVAELSKARLTEGDAV